ncbi:hypothetical protein P2R12_15710 [Cytobacillus oceanisediminis]|uniref:hypothetical protein n=1 Tax=Cytobacillus oceanisediminis TaxID=665099 RepID=UPI0023D99D4C|nr:hypothetical protein [Cytobacillus oceanisediminis]MDF2038406.1 hypothetical protein [Cytobacillus oceanisediminis]
MKNNYIVNWIGERVLNDIGGHHADRQERNEAVSILIELKINGGTGRLHRRFKEELYKLLHVNQIPYIEKDVCSKGTYEYVTPCSGKTLLNESQVKSNTLTSKKLSNAASISRPSRIHSQYPYILSD